MRRYRFCLRALRRPAMRGPAWGRVRRCRLRDNPEPDFPGHPASRILSTAEFGASWTQRAGPCRRRSPSKPRHPACAGWEAPARSPGAAEKRTPPGEVTDTIGPPPRPLSGAPETSPPPSARPMPACRDRIAATPDAPARGRRRRRGRGHARNRGPEHRARSPSSANRSPAPEEATPPRSCPKGRAGRPAARSVRWPRSRPRPGPSPRARSDGGARADPHPPIPHRKPPPTRWPTRCECRGKRVSEPKNPCAHATLWLAADAAARDRFRLAVSSCWNVGSLSNGAQATTVVVGFDMSRDGRPVDGTLRSFLRWRKRGGRAQQAYEAARRAILRCGVNGGYGLPAKATITAEVELVFHPEGMRLR